MMETVNIKVAFLGESEKDFSLTFDTTGLTEKEKNCYVYEQWHDLENTGCDNFRMHTYSKNATHSIRTKRGVEPNSSSVRIFFKRATVPNSNRPMKLEEIHLYPDTIKNMSLDDVRLLKHAASHPIHNEIYQYIDIIDDILNKAQPQQILNNTNISDISDIEDIVNDQDKMKELIKNMLKNELGDKIDILSNNTTEQFTNFMQSVINDIITSQQTNQPTPQIQQTTTTAQQNPTPPQAQAQNAFVGFKDILKVDKELVKDIDQNIPVEEPMNVAVGGLVTKLMTGVPTKLQKPISFKTINRRASDGETYTDIDIITDTENYTVSMIDKIHNGNSFKALTPYSIGEVPMEYQHVVLIPAGIDCSLTMADFLANVILKKPMPINGNSIILEPSTTKVDQLRFGWFNK